MRTNFLILLALSATYLNPLITDAQIHQPEEGFLFDDAEVPRIDIAISSYSLEALYADPSSNSEYRALFSFSRGDSTEIVSDIGLRFKGNNSRENKKKSFRISFNSFDSGRDFHGIEKMNLNAETDDPSLIRSRLSWNLYRYLGVAGSRTNHVLLYINNEFYGVYNNTEHVDEKFVRSRFGSNDGNLYKCLDDADLNYLGDDQASYKFEKNDQRVYEQIINEEWDDYEDLVRFVRILHQFSGDPLKEELERVFNVQQYLKVMAVDVMTGNWDGYIGNENNYFLYRDPVTGRFEYIPSDLDNTFGIDWLGVEWSNRSIYLWQRGEKPLYEKILQVEEFKEQYTAYIKRLANYVTSDTLVQEMNRWRALIDTAIGQDPYYPLDWGYQYADFKNALDSAWGGHVIFGIREYISLRVASALEECIEADALPLISHARIKPSTGRIDVDWTVEDDNPGYTTTLHYRIDQSEWESRLMDTPMEIDEISGMQTYRNSILSMGDEALVDLYITARDQTEQEVRFPATYFSVSFPLVSGPLYINEFVASNSSTRVDEFGQYDDWVEIYNPADTPVWLGDLYLSDDMGVPGRYKFPDEYIGPEGFYTVWLDGDPEQGVNHAPFKISKEGEELRLSERPANGFTLMDSITFGLQQTDVSLGRSTDGGSEWIGFSQPTPGYSNLSTGWDEKPEQYRNLSIFPNPVSDGTLHFNRLVSGSIYNVMGQKMMDLHETNLASVESLISGIYIFISLKGESLQFVVAAP